MTMMSELDAKIKKDLEALQDIATRGIDVPQQKPELLAMFIKQFTDNSNAIIDFVSRNCGSELALAELLARHNEVLGCLLTQYKNDVLTRRQ